MNGFTAARSALGWGRIAMCACAGVLALAPAATYAADAAGATGPTGTDSSIAPSGLTLGERYQLDMTEAGFDRFGLRVQSTQTRAHGTVERVGIRCWAGHHGTCTARLLVSRLLHFHTPVRLGTTIVHVLPGHERVYTVRFRAGGRAPIFATVMPA